MWQSWTLFLFFFVPSFGRAQERTDPPDNAVVVRQNTTLAGEFSTISEAINSLPQDGSRQVLFIHPGWYSEQINITREGPLVIYGYTVDSSSFENNVVTISHNASLATAGSDDLSGTLRVHKDDFSMYNVDVRNDFGPAQVNGQALAVSAFGNRMAFYGSRFFSYQDTLYANRGTQVYARSYIEGAVDFIFGRDGQVYFENNTLASISAGCVTANGRESPNGPGIYIFNNNNVTFAPYASSNTFGRVFLGRPWGNFARVVFKNTAMGSHVNAALWSVWEPSDNRTSDALFATFQNNGPASQNDVAVSFATALTAEQAAEYTIATALGSNYSDWVDMAYIS